MEPQDKFKTNFDMLGATVIECTNILSLAGFTLANPVAVNDAFQTLKKWTADDLIVEFIKVSHSTCWDKVHSKDRPQMIVAANDTFLGILKDAQPMIYQMLAMINYNIFDYMYNAKDAQGVQVLDEKLIQSIWNYMAAMIRISIRYIHKKRQTDTQFMADVDYMRHAKTWSISHEFE